MLGLRENVRRRIALCLQLGAHSKQHEAEARQPALIKAFARRGPRREMRCHILFSAFIVQDLSLTFSRDPIYCEGAETLRKVRGGRVTIPDPRSPIPDPRSMTHGPWPMTHDP